MDVDHTATAMYCMLRATGRACAPVYLLHRPALTQPVSILKLLAALQPAGAVLISYE